MPETAKPKDKAKEKEKEKEKEPTPLELFLESIRAELQQVRSEMKEIGLLVEQSQGEVEKLAQRNATITAHVHQLQAHFDTVPREDIKSAYEHAQDAQQRLFTMRGQLEKLQSDQAHLKRYAETLAKTLQTLEGTGSLDLPEGSPVAPPSGGIEQIIEAQEEERRKISRHIHDGPAQALANFILQTEIAMRLFDMDQDKARQELNSLKASASSTFASVRDFIFDLRPMMLDDLGLIPTARRYVDAYKEKTGLNVSMIVTGTERRLEPHREVLVFRGIQELLANVRDHAQATQVKVMMDVDAAMVRVVVEDNGRGYDPAAAMAEGAKGRGLQTLKSRVTQVGGAIEVESSPGSGSKVTFSIPAGT
jgi:two-component system, NarL family, sensor histidine kinase DegS